MEPVLTAAIKKTHFFIFLVTDLLLSSNGCRCMVSTRASEPSSQLGVFERRRAERYSRKTPHEV